jgi:thiol-disulfide isomerase/thioredoxin
MKKFLFFTITFSLVSLSSFSQLNVELNEENNSFIRSLMNKPIKKFSLTDLENKNCDSEKLKGKIVVMNFWFTACKPCILEMPHLNKLVEENKNNPVVFIAPAPEEVPQIRRFLKKYSFDYNIIPASLGYITDLNVESFPTHLVIDRKGIIRKVFIGYADNIKEKLQVEINKLIN